ncbi:hypothetical protein ABZ671_16945 [Micromonospora sp. NPDC006766]|uniref:hypothetical protein n=1 Tax=Micromonospora sp. NPDC006766 TaxID=3154778 RepID=UPI0033E5C724
MTTSKYAWGYAVRREWSNGSHDLFGFTSDKGEAERSLTRDQSYWRRGPVRPVAVYVVAANASAVEQHAVDGCRSASCPDSPKRGELR